MKKTCMQKKVSKVITEYGSQGGFAPPRRGAPPEEVRTLKKGTTKPVSKLPAKVKNAACCSTCAKKMK